VPTGWSCFDDRSLARNPRLGAAWSGSDDGVFGGTGADATDGLPGARDSGSDDGAFGDVGADAAGGLA
jgi:hypothetical protein